MIPTYQFDSPYHLRKIILVGAGGTGAQIARGLGRILFDMKTRQLSIPQVIIFDPDTVEQRNIGRQLFAPGDIGENKAEVVAHRTNLVFGLNITAAAKHFTVNTLGDFSHNIYMPGSSTLLIGAVDNAKARQEIAQAINKGGIWIDCGNHEHTGQIVIGNHTATEPNNYKPHSRQHNIAGNIQPHDAYDKLPAPHIVFPDLLLPDPEPNPVSCANLLERNQQALFINDWMALAALGYIQKLLMREPIHTWITYVDAQHLNMRSILVSPENITQMLAQAKSTGAPTGQGKQPP